jgi:hypothetical protein
MAQSPALSRRETYPMTGIAAASLFYQCGMTRLPMAHSAQSRTAVHFAATMAFVGTIPLILASGAKTKILRMQ